MNTLKTFVIDATLRYINSYNGIPYINVQYDAAMEFGGDVPAEHFNEMGVMAFDLSPNACASLKLGTDEDDIDKLWILCSFNQIVTTCVVPIVSITSIFDKDTFEGQAFRLGFDLEKERQREKKIKKAINGRPKVIVVKK